MSDSLPERPRARPVELIPFEENGQRTFVLQDPAGFLDAPLQLSQAALLLLFLCDGSRDSEAIRRDFESRTGGPLAPEQLEEFLQTMDRARLLDSPAFARHRMVQEAEFAACESRASVHAGTAYEGDHDKLAVELDRLLDEGESGGRSGMPPSMLVAPHIDLHRGGAGYGKAYRTLRGGPRPDVVVVLGTGHAAEEGRFILCDKGFETPRGNLPSDREFLGRLERRLGGDYRRGVLAHKNEHSIEFQALFVAHLFPESPPAIVPVLCTSFDDCMRDDVHPRDVAEVHWFVEALRETLREEERRVLVLVGADLSHVGPRFGDEGELTDEMLAQVRERDHKALDAMLQGGADGFYEAVAEHGNAHRICSVASIYAALHAARPAGGDLLSYDQAVDPARFLAVTFAAVALHGTEGE